MSLFVIRARKRFAVCRQARLRRPGRRALHGLLIELSLEGCRLSNLPPDAFEPEQSVVLRLDGAAPIECRIRWIGADGTAGLRFARPLHAAALDELIRLCRASPPNEVRSAAA